VAIDQAVVDLVRQVLVDEVLNRLRGLLPEDGRRLVDGEERGVVLGDEVLHEREAFPGAHDGEGEEDTEQEGRHARHRHVHPDVAASRADQQRRRSDQHAGRHRRPDDDLPTHHGRDDGA
jgi:hypothetical protein